jgi:phospholipase A-2-activating protein
MYPDERSMIEEAFMYLEQAIAGVLPITAPAVKREHVNDIIGVLERWPSGARFPCMSSDCDVFYVSVLTPAGLLP